MLNQHPTESIEISKYFREKDALDRQQDTRRERLRQEYKEILQTRRGQIEREIQDQLSTAQEALDLDFENKHRILDERYRRRWPVQPTANDGVTFFSDSFAEQLPSALLGSSQAMGQILSHETGGPPQSPESQIFALFPRTPSPLPIDPRMLSADLQIRPETASPSTVNSHYPEVKADDGTCNSPIPCQKGGYTCDHHKPYEQIAE